jgi:hypothetical protein
MPSASPGLYERPEPFNDNSICLVSLVDPDPFKLIFFRTFALKGLVLENGSLSLLVFVFSKASCIINSQPPKVLYKENNIVIEYQKCNLTHNNK